MKLTLRSHQLASTGSLGAGMALLLVISSCVNQSDPELAAYVDFRKIHRDDLDMAFRAVPDNQKMKLFFGAMKLEPPDLAVESLIANQNYPFLVKLRARIAERGNFVETYSFNNAVIEMRGNGRISRSQIDSLQLQSLCSITNANLALCNHQIALAQGDHDPNAP